MNELEDSGRVKRSLVRRPVAIAVTVAVALVISACVPLAFLGQGERGADSPSSLPAEPGDSVASFASASITLS